MNAIRRLSLAAALSAALLLAGCARESHRSVRMYESTDAGPREEAQPVVEEGEEEVIDESEWHMTSPGTPVVEP